MKYNICWYGVQLCGGHRTTLVALLNRCSSALPRAQAAGQRCYAHSNRDRSLSAALVSEHQASKHKASAPRPPQRSTRGRPDASAPAAAELTAAIHACSCPAQLVDLYQRHGDQFTAIHAYVALNHLVDVTLSPDDLEEDDPNAAGDAASGQDGRLAQKQQHHNTQQLTGRLRVHQGQDFAQPPLHAEPAAAAASPQREEREQLDERRESNYAASTSDASASPSLRSSHSHRGKRHAAPPQAAADQLDPQGHPQPEPVERLTPDIEAFADIDAMAAAAAPQLPPPPRRMVVSMVSGLAAVLSHACHRLDGRGVAETARALSRLRYQHASLLGRLEQRALKLMAKGSMPGVSGSRGGGGSSKAAASAFGRKGKGKGWQAHRGDAGAADGSGSTSSSNSSNNGGSAVPAALGSGPQRQEHGRPQHGMGADDLYTMVAAFGAMGHRPSEAWRAAVVASTQPHLPAYAASRRGRLPLLLSSLGSFGGPPPPPEWLRAACVASLPRLAACPPRQLRALAAGLAAMRYHPGDPWVAEFLAVSERRMDDFSPWELVSTVASLAALRCSPGEPWMERFYACTAAMVGTAGGLTGRLLNCRPAGEWLTLLLLGTRRSLAEASGEELTNVLSALARLRFRPPEPWLQHYFTASFQRLPFLMPDQACAAAVALAALGRRPQPLWLQELGCHMGRQLALMPGDRQAAALAALVDLGYRPSARWLEAYEKQSNGRLAETAPGELCSALAALAKVGFRPQASWLYAFILAVYSKLDTFDSAQLALVFDRLPALTPHGAWLDEIIQICATEAATRATQAQAQASQSQLQLQQQQEEEAHSHSQELSLHERQPHARPELLAPPQPQQQQLAQQQGQEAGTGAEVAIAEAVVFASAEDAPAAVAPATASQAELASATSGFAAAEEPVAVRSIAVDGAAAAATAVGVRSSDGIVVQGASGLGSGSAVPPLSAAQDTAASAPAEALTATIPIAAELVSAASDVLLMPAAPCGGGGSSSASRGTLLSGASSVGLLGDSGFGSPGLGADDDDDAAATAELLQRIPQGELLVVEPSAVALAALAQSSSSSGVDGNGASAVTANGSANGNGSSASRRSRRRGDGPGGGGGSGDGDGGSPSGGSWDDDLFADVGAAAAGGSGRTPDVGLLQRPRVGRAPAAAVLASVSAAAAAAIASGAAVAPSSPRGAHPAAVAATTAVSAATPSSVGLTGAADEPWSGSDRGVGFVAAPAAAAAPVPVTLQPKPRPLGAVTQPSAAPGSMAATAIEAPAVAAGAAQASLPGSPGGTGAGVAAEASKPLLPFGSAPQGVPMCPAAAAATAAAGAAAAAAADDSRVQYLDSASLSRLIGPPDGPPGPDFSGCQKRAKQGRAARGAGGAGPFQLGRIWNNDGDSSGGAGRIPGPLPSPSG
ncbi:hypothetical protein PLESTM_001707600 [Pleodorina starrii]|nr:hypothetical protein PLESTM_001707600 [Pleodorina starrii]